MNLIGARLRNFYNIGTNVNDVIKTEDEKFIDDELTYHSLNIPHYQRPFKWDEDLIIDPKRKDKENYKEVEKEIEENSFVLNLINDWHNQFVDETKKDPKYFAGSIVIVAPKEQDSYYSLVDGQQRYTTLFLTNFIHFSLLRVLLLRAIEVNNTKLIEEYIREIKRSYLLIFKSKHDSNYQTNLFDFFEKINEVNSSNIEVEKDGDEEGAQYIQGYDIQEVRRNLYLPEFTSNESYKNNYKINIKKLFDELRNRNILLFNLTYDRESYNKSLERVLSDLVVDVSKDKELYFSLEPSEEYNGNERVYEQAINNIISKFQKLASITNNKKASPLSLTRKIHTLMSSFLEMTRVCVVQTGDIEDAYDLFEVLNDRSLALDDLDLIKNQFFRKYVLCEKSNNPGCENLDNIDNIDDIIDNNIQKLDEIWVDKIFDPKVMLDTKKKLITYLATIYITHNESINFKDKETYRVHLKRYLDQTESYSYNQILRDFNIFNTCKIIVEKVNLPYKSKNKAAYSCEADINSSQFKKTILLLNALNMEGVIAGLVNYTLRALQTLDPDFSPTYSEEFVNLLLTNKTPSKTDLNKIDQKLAPEITNLYTQIQEQATELWKIVIMASDYEKPRGYALGLIGSNNLHSSINIRNNHISIKNLDTEFKEWIKSWSFSKNSKIKIKILFLRLIQRQYNSTNKIVESCKTPSTFSKSDAESIELDHVVAQNSDDTNYILDNNGIDNEDFITRLHGLGNMMLLPKVDNREKSNKSLDEIIQLYVYSDVIDINSHFIGVNLASYVKELAILLESYKNNISKISTSKEKSNSHESDQEIKEMLQVIDNRRDFLISCFEQVVLE